MDELIITAWSDSLIERLGYDPRSEYVEPYKGVGRPPRALIYRVLDHLDRSGECWEWTGFRTKDGYGLIVRTDGERPKQARVHRVVAEYILGRRLRAEEHICHRCDNPPCGRPSHLFLGDAKANQADAKAKGRTARGERQGSSKLTVADVALIRESERSARELAAELGVTARNIRRIRQGTRWAS